MTIGDQCAIMGQRQPVRPAHAAKVCEDCGSQDRVWGPETVRNGPEGTGFDAEFCAACGEPTGERDWTGW